MDDEFKDANQFPRLTRRKPFPCPHCGEMCSVPIEIRILEPEKFQAEAVTVADPFAGLTPDQRAIIDAAEKTGLLPAFTQALGHRFSASEHMPKSPGRFLITFLRLAAPKRAPAFIVRHYTRQFPGRIEFWGAEGILGVTADGKFRAFLPTHLALGVGVKKANGSSSSLRLPVDEAAFADWVKTRHGYVPASCALFVKELQKRSIGEFAAAFTPGETNGGGRR
jgi:hypothetical protein